MKLVFRDLLKICCETNCEITEFRFMGQWTHKKRPRAQRGSSSSSNSSSVTAGLQSLLARLQRAVSPQPPQGAFNMMAGGAELEVPCCVMVLVVCAVGAVCDAAAIRGAMWCYVMMCGDAMRHHWCCCTAGVGDTLPAVACDGGGGGGGCGGAWCMVVVRLCMMCSAVMAMAPKARVAVASMIGRGSQKR